MNTELDTHATVTIERLNERGLGVTHVGEAQVVVPFALPGEEVEIDVIYPKRREPWAKVVRWITKSPQRREAPCEHFGQCGGCLLQHLNEEDYQQFKIDNLKNLLKEHGLNPEVPGDRYFIPPHQRRRIDISGRMTEEGLVLGFHNINSKRPFTVKMCAVLHPEIEKLFEPLRAFLESILVERETIHVFFTVADNGVDVMLAGLKRSFDDETVQRLVAFAEEHNLVRLVFKAKKRVTLYERETPHIQFGGFPVEVASNAFLQASGEADRILADLVLQNIPQDSGRVADLFCGRGTLSLPMIAAGYPVDGYECDDHALAALNQVNAPGLRTYPRNLFEDPLTVEELNQYDTIVVDPPRSGIKDQAEIIGESHVKRVIYVSCGPESFARDSAKLIQSGYTMTQLYLVDQFIWTPHLEVVGVFNSGL